MLWPFLSLWHLSCACDEVLAPSGPSTNLFDMLQTVSARPEPLVLCVAESPGDSFFILAQPSIFYLPSFDVTVRSECLSCPPQVLWLADFFQVEIRTTLTFQHVNITGRHLIKSDCSEEWCFHCQDSNFFYFNGTDSITVINHHSFDLSDPELAEKGPCIGNSGKDFFKVLSFGLLRFVDSAIDEVRVRYRSFVYLQHSSSLEVTDSTFSGMDFIDAVVSGTSSTAARLVRTRVAGLNRDHPYSAPAFVIESGFLNLFTNFIEILDCVFEDNYFLNARAAANPLIFVTNFQNATILSTVVRRSMSSIKLRSTSAALVNATVLIANCRFEGNTARTGLLLMTALVHSDVVLDNCEFRDNLVHDDTMISFILPLEGTLAVLNSAFVNNRLRSRMDTIDIIYLKAAQTFTLANSSFVDNGNYTEAFPLLLAQLLGSGLVNDSPDLRELEMNVVPTLCRSVCYAIDTSDLSISNASFANGAGNFCIYMISANAHTISSFTLNVDDLTIVDAFYGFYIEAIGNAPLFAQVRWSTFTRVGVLPMGCWSGSNRVSTCVVDRCEFVDCGGRQCSAGAIAAYTRTLRVTNSRFSSLHCSSGGIISFQPSSYSNIADITVLDSHFADNIVSAATFQGIIVILSEVSPVKIRIVDCEFVQSQQTHSAIIYINNIIVSDALIQGCRFLIEAEAVNEVFSINHASGLVRISDITFSGLTQLQYPLISVVLASSNSGSMPVTQLHNVTVSHSRLLAVLSARGNYYRARVESTDCVFMHNVGTVIDLQRGNLTDLRSVFFNNTSTLCVKHSAGSSVAFTSSTFLNNAASDMGVLLIAGPRSDAVFSDCTFSQNRALEGSGILHVEGSAVLSLQGCRFLDNNASHSTIFDLTDTNTPLSVSDSVFTGNGGIAQASGSSLLFRNVTVISGGSEQPAFELIRSSLTILDSDLSGFKGGLGCVVYANLLNTVALAGTLIHQSQCEQALFWLSSGSLMAVDNSRVDSVVSLHSSIVYVETGGGLDASYLTVRNVAAQLAVVEMNEADLSLNNSHFANVHGTVVFAQRTPNVLLNAVAFESVSAAAGSGGLFCELCTQISIARSTFTGVRGPDAAAVSATADSVHIRESRFSDTVGAAHGAVKVTASSFVLERSQFLNNSASGAFAAGGAVEIDSSLGVVTDCSFEGNRAKVGGAVHWSSNRPSVVHCHFVGNEAELFGDDYASYVHALRSNATSLPELASGQVFKGTVGIDMVDHYGQVVSTPESRRAMLIGAALSGELTASAASGHFAFSGFVVIGTPGTVVTVSVELLGTDISREVSLSLRDCLKGEIEENKACVQCAANTYSLYLKSTKCSICPNNAICRNGHMYPLSGYWRPDGDYDGVLQCPRAESCIGHSNYTSEAGLCLSFYGGNLCQSCAQGASRSSKDHCEKCPDRGINTLRLSLAAVGVFAVIVVLTRSAMTSARKEQNPMGTLLKIFLNYLQLTMMISHFDLDWPYELRDFFSFHESVGNGGEQFMSVDCLTSDAFFKKVIAAAVLPVCLLSANFAFWALVWVVYRLRRKVLFFKQKFVCSLIVSLFYFYPFIVRSSLSAFQCVTIRPGELWVRLEMAYRCWDQRHSYYTLLAALPTIILWGAGIPALALLFLIRHRKELERPEVKNMVGFLSQGYRADRYYWEVVIMYRKVCILLLYVFMSALDPLLQALALGAVLWASAYLQARFHTFSTREMNREELLSIWACLATTFAGLCFSTRALATAAEAVLFALVLTANVYFIASLWKGVALLALSRVKRAFRTLATKMHSGSKR